MTARARVLHWTTTDHNHQIVHVWAADCPACRWEGTHRTQEVLARIDARDHQEGIQHDRTTARRLAAAEEKAHRRRR